jgi:hypothetical protein
VNAGIGHAQVVPFAALRIEPDFDQRLGFLAMRLAQRPD